MKEWIYGRNAVLECLLAGRRNVFRLRFAQGINEDERIQKIRKLCGQRKILVERVSRQVLDGYHESNQGVAAEVSAYPYADIHQIKQYAVESHQPLFLLVLDVIQNPQNLGTLIRSAEAFGAHGILIPLRQAAGITPAVVNASAGAVEHMLVASGNLALVLEELKKDDVWVIGLEGSGESQPIDQVRLDGALALVVGSEGEGMRKLTRRMCDVMVRVPMSGRMDSLNAAVAGSIALYLAAQTRSEDAR